MLDAQQCAGDPRDQFGDLSVAILAQVAILVSRVPAHCCIVLHPSSVSFLRSPRRPARSGRHNVVYVDLAVVP